MAIDVYINDGLPNADEVSSGRVSHIETCLFWRCARSVLNDGNPASDNVVVCVSGRNGGQYPLFIMTLTKAGRLVCWPVLPDGICSPEHEAKLYLIDHMTLDLRNRRSHSSAYSPTGGKLPTAQQWTPHAFPAKGISLWFGFAVRLSVVEGQALQRHQWIRFPTPDTQRRKDEYVRFFQRLQFVDVDLPAGCESTSDALCGSVYIVDDVPVTLPNELWPPFDPATVEFMDALGEQRTVQLRSRGFSVGSVQLGLRLGVVPRGLREDGPFFLTPGRV